MIKFPVIGGGGGGGGGTVTSVGVMAGSGISASVSNPTTTPVISIAATGGGGGGGLGISVLDFGADPSGAAPSDVAFEAVKAAAVNNTFYIPAGNFMLTPANGLAQAPGQAIIFDAGPCKIYMDPNARIFAAPGAYEYTCLFRLGAGVSLFQGIVDFGAGTGPMTDCWGVDGISGTSGVSVKDTEFVNCANGLLRLLGVNDQSVKGCTYTNAPRGYQGSGDRLEYKNNTANGGNTMRVGHQIQGGTTIEASGNKSHGVTETGLQAAGTNLTLSDNVTDELLTDGVKAIWVGGLGTTPVGIIAKGNIADFGNTAGEGAILLEEVSQATVIGNPVRGALGRLSYGVKFTASAGVSDPVNSLGNLRDWLIEQGNQVSIPATNKVVFEGTNFGQNISSESGPYSSLSNGYASSGAATIVEPTTARTLSNTDNGKTIITTNAAAIAITVPVQLLPGFSCTLIQKGLGQWTAQTGAPNSRVVSTTGLTSAGQNARAVLQNYGEQDVYLLTGNTLILPSAAKLSTVNKNSRIDLSGSDLVATADVTATDNSTGIGDTAVSGGAQIYLEAMVTAVGGAGAASLAVGIANIGIVGSGGLNNNAYLGRDSHSLGYYGDGQTAYNGSPGPTLAAFTTGDVLGISIKDNDQVWFRVGTGDWNNDPTADPTTAVGGISITGIGDVFAGYTMHYATSAAVLTFNFGGTPFVNAPPTNYIHLP